MRLTMRTPMIRKNSRQTTMTPPPIASSRRAFLKPASPISLNWPVAIFISRLTDKAASAERLAISAESSTALARAWYCS